jgi:vacuolar-type H+-ATPase subunit H
LEELVAEGRKLPLRGGLMVDRQRLLDLIDQLRIAVPADIHEAQKVMQSQDQILAQARKDSEEILIRADSERNRQLQDHEMTRQAEENAQRIIDEASERARELVKDAENQARARLDESMTTAQQQMSEADLYALQSLRRLEGQIENFLTTIRRGIDTFEGKRR